MFLQKSRRIVAFAMILSLLFSSFVNIGLVPVHASTPLTVIEAIARNNDGTNQTVEGYIVAHTTGTNSYNFTAPFAGNTNFAIADSPNERTASKIMPVELLSSPSSIRTTWGLQTNPNNIGKKVRITGNLVAYFSTKGLKGATLFELVPDGTVTNVTAQPAAGAVKAGTTVNLQTSTVSASVYYSVYDAHGATIAENVYYTTPIPITEDTTIKAYAQKNGMVSEVTEFAYTILSRSDIAAVRLMNAGVNTLIEGIVTYKEYSGGQYNLYVQDTTAGIVVRTPDTSANIGDKIRAEGETLDYNGLAELIVESVDHQVLEMNAGVPSPVAIDSRGFVESNEGKLIKIENVTIGTGNQFNEFTINDAYGSLMIKSSWVETGKQYDQIIGVLTYSFGNYMLLPRSFSDIIEENFSVTSNIQPGIVTVGTAVYLSSPTTGAKVFYTIDGTTPTASSTEYTAPISINTDTTIKAIAVNGSQTSGVYTFEYITQKTFTGKKIHDIQGAGHESPVKGHKVEGVQGVVTHTDNIKGTKRFYIQELAANYDSDSNTSEAILVVSLYTVAVGDFVTVDGTVSEIKEDGYADAKDLTTTALTNPFITKIGTQSVPAAVVIGIDRIQPKSVIDNDGLATFDPAEDSIDFYESLESMRVQLDNPTVVGPFDFEIPVVVGDQTGEVLTPNGGLIITGQDLNPQRMLIKKDLDVKTGDLFNGAITGVLGYDFSNYKVLPTETMPTITASSITREETSIVPSEDKLTIAGFNVENFWNNPNSSSSVAKTNKIAQVIVTNLKTPDIIGLIEVQDNNGATDNGVVDASENFKAIIDAIKTAGGPTYQFTDIAPENNKDGGADGGNIRVGYLYNPARVTLVNKPQGDSFTSVSYGSDGLSLNPGRIDPANPAFNSSRKPLASEFDFRGERVVVIDNHFNSKTGDPAPYGAVQPMPNPLGSEVQRHQIATVVNGFVKNVLQQDPNANVVLLGDFNDFQFSQTLSILKGNELTNMVDALPENERYSYVYQGNSQTLDHILVDKKLKDYASLDIVHINADFDEAHGRVSDHDPLLVQLDLAAKPDDSASNGNIKLQLLSVNDLHGKINDKYSEKSLNEDLNGDTVISSDVFVGGMDYMAAALKQRESTNPNTLIVHVGDMVGGSPPISALFQDEPTVEIMEATGFDVGTVGNHEFDEGTAEMLRLLNGGVHKNGTAGYDGQNFPLTVANVVFKSNKQPVLPPYIIKEVEGVKVGFIGVVTEETPQIVVPAGIEDIEFTDAAEAVNQAAADLKAQGVKSIVVLAHIPANDAGDSATGDAAELANKVDDEVDVIFAGHNHQRVVGTVDGKLIVQAWEYAKAFADVDLEIDRTTGDIVKKNAEIVYNLQTNADPTVKGIIEKYNTEAAPFLNRVVGNSAVEMKKDYPGMGIGVNGDKDLGNMIADGMRAEMGADFALMNGGGVRENLNSGEITWGELFSIQPFNNVLVKLEVAGADLEAILNAQLGSGSNFGPDFHVSGFKYTWYRDAANNRKVVDIILTDGSKIDKTKTYTVVVNNFMQTSTSPKNIEIGKRGKNPVTGPEDLEATVNFVSSFEGPLNYAPEGRIKEIAVPDMIAPVWPDTKSLTAPARTTGSVTLEWTAATDNVAVTGYKVFNGDTSVTTVADSVYTVNGLTPGTNYIFKVEAVDEAGNMTTDGPTVQVTTLRNRNSGSGSGSSGTGNTGNNNPNQGQGATVTPAATETGVELQVNPADLKTETTADGKTVTKLLISPESLAQALTLAGENGSGKTIVINLSNVEGAAKVELPADALTAAAGGAEGTVIKIMANGKTYELPLSTLKVEALAASLGASSDKVIIGVTIETVTGPDAQPINSAASLSGVTVISDVVSFTVTAEADGQSMEINDFGATYVNRTITVNQPVDSNEATAVVYDTATGEMSFVPALFDLTDGGNTLVTIKRNSNSIYTVVKSVKNFADLNGHWSQKDVGLLASKLVVNGQTETLFAPDSNITRAEFAALVVRALGLKVESPASAGVSLKDVKVDDWYAGVLGAAVKLGLMEGFEDGTFRPNANITREQMAVMISRAMAAAGKSNTAVKIDVGVAFADRSSINDWAIDAVAQNTAAGIIQGTQENKFEPAQFATRAEAAVMLKRLLEYVEFIN